MLQIALMGLSEYPALPGNAGSWSRRLMCGGLGAQESEAELK